MSTQIKRPLRLPKVPVKKAKSPLSHLVGSYWANPEQGAYGVVTAEPLPFIFELSHTDEQGRPQGVKSYINPDSIFGTLFFTKLEAWQNEIGQAPCDCGECEEEEEEFCECPSCAEERAKSIACMETAEATEAIERTVQDTIADSVPSAQVEAECRAELKAFEGRNTK
jgi:hypothetical protein